MRIDPPFHVPHHDRHVEIGLPQRSLCVAEPPLAELLDHRPEFTRYVRTSTACSQPACSPNIRPRTPSPAPTRTRWPNCATTGVTWLETSAPGRRMCKRRTGPGCVSYAAHLSGRLAALAPSPAMA